MAAAPCRTLFVGDRPPMSLPVVVIDAFRPLKGKNNENLLVRDVRLTRSSSDQCRCFFSLVFTCVIGLNEVLLSMIQVNSQPLRVRGKRFQQIIILFLIQVLAIDQPVQTLEVDRLEGAQQRTG